MIHRLPLAFVAATTLAAEESFPVTIRIDAAQPFGELHPIWRSSVTVDSAVKLFGRVRFTRP